MTVTTDRTRKIHMLADPTWDPANYDFVDAFDAYPEPPTFAHETEELAELLKLLTESPTSEYEWYDHAQCDHCGAHIRYVVLLLHRPTGDHIAIGQDCATERFNEPDRISYLVKRAAQRRAAAKERAEVDAKLAAFGAEHPGLLEFFQDYSDAHEAGVRHYSDDFVLDVGRKLTKYASISDRQISAVGKAFERDGKKEAERFSAEPELSIPVPEGRRTFTGVIAGERTEEGDYGTYTKILVKVPEGYKVWLTKPSAISSAERGDTVSITATLTRSNKDQDFGFGKRPAKAFIVKRGDRD